jgi:hypothetical protein
MIRGRGVFRTHGNVDKRSKNMYSVKGQGMRKISERFARGRAGRV